MRGTSNRRGSRKKLEELRQHLAQQEERKNKLRQAERRRELIKKNIAAATIGFFVVASVCYLLWEVI